MDETTLRRYLQSARDALLWKLDGLDERAARRPLTPTGTNLLGLVKHAAGIEIGYFGVTFGRERPGLTDLPWVQDDAEDNADMWATPEESTADVVALYRRVWELADETFAELGMEGRGTVPWWGPARRDVTVGQVIVHVTADLTRHAGQADVVRELIDGSVGMADGNLNLPPLDAAGWSAYVARLEAAAEEAGRRYDDAR